MTTLFPQPPSSLYLVARLHTHTHIFLQNTDALARTSLKHPKSIHANTEEASELAQTTPTKIRKKPHNLEHTPLALTRKLSRTYITDANT